VPGTFLVRLHRNRYWTVDSGSACVTDRGEATLVEARARGPIQVSARFSLAALFGRDRQCSG
jgi:hypothetical protein